MKTADKNHAINHFTLKSASINKTSQKLYICLNIYYNFCLLSWKYNWPLKFSNCWYVCVCFSNILKTYYLCLLLLGEGRDGEFYYWNITYNPFAFLSSRFNFKKLPYPTNFSATTTTNLIKILFVNICVCAKLHQKMKFRGRIY